MTLEEAFTADLTATLAGVLADRVYPDAGPQRDGPNEQGGYAVYQHAGDDNLHSLAGGRVNPRIDTYSVDFYATDRGLLEQCREALYDRYAGANCQGYWGGIGGGVWVQGATVSDAAADASSPAQGDEELDRAERMTVRIVWDRR